MLCHLLHPKGGTSAEQGPKPTQRSPGRTPHVQHLVLLPASIGKTLPISSFRADALANQDRAIYTQSLHFSA